MKLTRAFDATELGCSGRLKGEEIEQARYGRERRGPGQKATDACRHIGLFYGRDGHGNNGNGNGSGSSNSGSRSGSRRPLAFPGIPQRARGLFYSHEPGREAEPPADLAFLSWFCSVASLAPLPLRSRTDASTCYHSGRRAFVTPAPPSSDILVAADRRLLSHICRRHAPAGRHRGRRHRWPECGHCLASCRRRGRGRCWLLRFVTCVTDAHLLASGADL